MSRGERQAFQVLVIRWFHLAAFPLATRTLGRLEVSPPLLFPDYFPPKAITVPSSAPATMYPSQTAGEAVTGAPTS